MLLCTCGNAAIIEHFSIEIGQIYKKGSEEVGHVIKSVSKEKADVKIADYNGKTYFVKSAPLLELRDKIGSIIASRILNEIFKDKEKRYPLLSLAFNPNYLLNENEESEPFHILSPQLESFSSIADIASKQPIEKTEIRVDDMENLYMGLYLVGGGDPHMHNIFYNLENYHLGSVDLDVSFKEHISYFAEDKEKFKKTHLDLAIKTINCADIFSNFLFVTDSDLNHKIGWGYYDKNFPLYQENLKMNGTRLCESVNILRGAFPNTAKLSTFITNTVNDIKKDIKEIINKKLQLSSSENGTIFDATYGGPLVKTTK